MTVFGVCVDYLDHEDGVIELVKGCMPDLRLFGTWPHLAACLAAHAAPDRLRELRILAAQLWSFAHGIRSGDLLAVRRSGGDSVQFAEVSGDYRCIVAGSQGARHQRAVAWLTGPVGLDELEPDLRHSLRSLPLVRRIRSPNAQQRLQHLIARLRARSAQDARMSEADCDQSMMVAAGRDLASQGRDAIRKRMRSRYWGIRCEGLVEAILSAEGYDVLSVGPGPDGGLDLIAGSGPLGFGADRLAVQIKAGNRPMTAVDLAGFEASMLRSGARNGLVVSLAGFRGLNVRTTARGGFRLRLWDEEALLDAVLKVYERMPDAIRRDLPLKRVWVPDFA